MDLMWLDNKPVLQRVDIETVFHNAIFIKDKSATNLWNDFSTAMSLSTLYSPKLSHWTEKQISLQLNAEKTLMI